ncbi:MAG: Biotin carboxylase [Burkholderia sp.]|jgi:hypothetical protein
MTPPKIPRRFARTILQAFKGGVVPRVGLRYVAVGRKAEIDALLSDIEAAAEGGASCRFITGRYGSGKSFLIQTIRSYAMDRGFAVADADLSPERHLRGSGGKGLATYRELMQNLAVKTAPEGGALQLVLDQWVAALRAKAAAALSVEGLAPEGGALESRVEAELLKAASGLGGVLYGYEFTELLLKYARAGAAGDEETRARVVKWFRGEYATRTEAKADLGIGLIVSDESWYDFLKLFARFLKQAGYAGLIVFIDELINLYKIPNAVSRQYNYEKILSMYNDTLQGKAKWLGIVFGGTPQAVEDRRRGLFSYEALRSRLSSGRFAQEGRRDMLSPVLALEPLTPEELLVLIEKLAAMHAEYYGYQGRLAQDDLVKFLHLEFGREGAETHITPREVIRDFVELLDILMQHPETSPAELLTEESIAGLAPEKPAQQTVPGARDDLKNFTL